MGQSQNWQRDFCVELLVCVHCPRVCLAMPQHKILDKWCKMQPLMGFTQVQKDIA